MKLFLIYHDKKVLSEFELNNKYCLGELPVGEVQHPSMAETRFLYYLSNNLQLLDEEYVGICAASWNKKYKNTTPIEKLTFLNKKLKPNKIFVPSKTDDWYWNSKKQHPGLDLLIDEICDRNKMKNYGVSFWSNNFICHRNVMQKFLVWWLDNFNYFFKKYKFNPPFENNWDGYKDWLHPAYFYERLTVVYFANQNYQIHLI